MGVQTYLSLGSNLGDRLRNISSGIEAIQRHAVNRRVRVSPFFETEPWGNPEQSAFINCCVEIETLLNPDELLAAMKSIEAQMGRNNNRSRWSPRELDIDILLYGSVQVDSKQLTIPHRELTKRRFALEPLSCIAPELTAPSFGKSVTQLLEECIDESHVKEYIPKES